MVGRLVNKSAWVNEETMISLELICTVGFQRLAIGWLRLFSALYLSLAVFTPLGRYALVFQFLTILHFIGFLGVILLCSLPYYFTSSPSDRYIRTHHAAIWQKLHPWGRSSGNTFALFDFLSGRYDDGRDENLTLIKLRYRRLLLLQLWAFALCFTPYPLLVLKAIVISLVRL